MLEDDSNSLEKKSMDDAKRVLDSCLLLDLEVSRSGNVYHIGAVHRKDVFEKKGRFRAAEAFSELDRFAENADFILGHNIIAHDLPVIRRIYSDLGLFKLPVIDTLYLSPLAFPENPYHRLVKDYKLVRDSISNPVADALIAGSLFLDIWESFKEMNRRNPGQTAFYRACFEGACLHKELPPAPSGEADEDIADIDPTEIPSTTKVGDKEPLFAKHQKNAVALHVAGSDRVKPNHIDDTQDEPAGPIFGKHPDSATALQAAGEKRGKTDTIDDKQDDAPEPPIERHQEKLTAAQPSGGNCRIPVIIGDTQPNGAIDGDGTGIAMIFERIGAARVSGAEEAREVFSEPAKGLICPSRLDYIFRTYWPDRSRRPALCYALAWLTVSGGNSVLPPWVRYRYREIPKILSCLREEKCDDPECGFCMENHNPTEHLKRFFGYDGYRPLPDGTHLQEEIVSWGLSTRPLMGILPTGGGKSICFQIPALVRYYRRGLLTVVISPLQALMKDQVDNLSEKTGSSAAATINGLLTLPERGRVMEGVRMGDVGLLYISPEQLRNRSIKEMLESREIGCWVFDEAHCLSKWGHDFRPDYLYAARFIREFSERTGLTPTVSCYTATAKTDVIDEIIEHFKKELALDLKLFDGGTERENLIFEIRTITGHEKYETIHELLTEKLGPEPTEAAIIYCSTRNNTEELAGFLQSREWNCRHFHAGLTAPEKREIQEDFVAGSIPVISATNAFGMGIDKENVRLVIHSDIPGSLENYLQEAGRAGRDTKEAECILLYDEADIEEQFRLSTNSRLSKKDLAQILRGLRKAKRNREGNVVITAGELIRDDDVEAGFGMEDHNYATKVKTAISWLEKGGFVRRDDNRTSVFQGKPKFSSMEDAAKELDRLNLSPVGRRVWEMILSSMVNAPAEGGISADEICEKLGSIPNLPEEFQETRKVISIMNDMADQGLIVKSLLMSAWLKIKGKDSAKKVLDRVVGIEKTLLAIMEEESPLVEADRTLTLTYRLMNQKIRDKGFPECDVGLIRQLIKTLAWDGRGFGETGPSVEIRYNNKDTCGIRMKKEWDLVKRISKRRHELAALILDAVIEAAPPSNDTAHERLVEFSLTQLINGIENSITVIKVRKEKMMAAVEAGLLFLHSNKVIILQNGLAVFRQAMTLSILPEKPGRYTNKDFKPLEEHYGQRIFQIHVMNEYARIGAEKVRQALYLITSYFSMDNEAFIKKFFPRRKGLLAMATSENSGKSIVDALAHPVQESIVKHKGSGNMLILAGPGSGKTRVVVHRCAFLLRVKRVRARSILMLCFNHNAALSIRKRLFELIGEDARGVAIMTYHGLAMRLTGTALGTGTAPGNGTAHGNGTALGNGTASGNGPPLKACDQNSLSTWFDSIIREAIALLKGEKTVIGVDSDDVRDRLLAGYSHILVDEYQDIDADQYELIALLAGKTIGDRDRQLSMLAVGDDDQSIYGFRKAGVTFIRRFREDYSAAVFHLVENFRSTHPIIEVSNRLIEANTARMKTEHPITINRARQNKKSVESEQNGKDAVRLIEVAGLMDQAVALAGEIEKEKSLNPSLDYGDIAVLARNGLEHRMLLYTRGILSAKGIPVSLPLDKRCGFSLFRAREIKSFLEDLEGERDRTEKASQLIEDHLAKRECENNQWNRMLLDNLTGWQSETGDAPVYISRLIHFLSEALLDQKREQRMGKGVFLSTVHGVKGMEFPVVFMLDGGWRNPQQKAEMEEERRIFYVGMTRAEKQLTLFKVKGENNPHIDRLAGSPFLSCNAFQTPAEEKRLSLFRYEYVGMGDQFIDYAGRRREDDPIHKAISGLSTGDPVTLARRGSKIHILTREGISISVLSETCAGKFRHRLPLIEKATVIAMIQRRKEDCREEFRQRVVCDRWEVPIIEIAWREAPNYSVSTHKPVPVDAKSTNSWPKL